MRAATVGLILPLFIISLAACNRAAGGTTLPPETGTIELTLAYDQAPDDSADSSDPLLPGWAIRVTPTSAGQVSGKAVLYLTPEGGPLLAQVVPGDYQVEAVAPSPSPTSGGGVWSLPEPGRVSVTVGETTTITLVATCALDGAHQAMPQSGLRDWQCQPSFDLAPRIKSFQAEPSALDLGASTRLSWNVPDEATLTITPGVGTITGDQRTLTPTASTTYTLSATNTFATSERSVKVVVARAVTGFEPIGGQWPPTNALVRDWNGDLIAGGRGVRRFDAGNWTDIGQGLPFSPVTSLVNTGYSLLALSRPHATYSSSGDGWVYELRQESGTWTEVGNGLPVKSLRDLAVDGIGAAYVATDQGVFKRDRGTLEWRNIGPGNGTYHVVVAPSGDIYADAKNPERTYGYHLYRLPFGSSTWEAPREIPQASEHYNWVGDLAVGPDGSVFASATVAYHSVIEGVGVWRLPPNGSVWEDLTLDLPESNAELSASGGALYAGTKHYGIYRLLNGARHWEKVGTDSPVDASVMLAEGGALFAAGLGGVYRFPPLATHWEKLGLGNGLPQFPGGSGVDASGRIFVSADNGVYELTPSGWNIVDHAFQSFRFFAPVSSLLVQPEGTLYVGSGGGGYIFRRVPGDAAWTLYAEIGAGSAVFDLAAQPNGPLYAGHWTVFRIDGPGPQERTWINSPEGRPFAHDIALDGRGGVYAAFGDGVYRWRSGSDYWEHLGEIRELSELAVSPSGELLAGGAGVYRLELGTSDWQFLGDLLPLSLVRSLAFDPRGRLYAGGEGGVARLEEDGRWTLITAGLPVAPGVSTMTFLPDGRLLVVVASRQPGVIGGAYLSTP
jgi:hypothetical protein